MIQMSYISTHLNIYHMKKSIFIAAAFAAVTLISCKKTETVATDGAADSASIVVVDNDSVPIISDSSAVGEAINATGDAIEEGAESVKEGAQEATDGDGDATK